MIKEEKRMALSQKRKRKQQARRMKRANNPRKFYRTNVQLGNRLRAQYECKCGAKFFKRGQVMYKHVCR